MVTSVGYKVTDLSPRDDASPAYMERVLNEHAKEEWGPVTGFQRAHKALQVGSTATPVRGLLSTVSVFKQAE
jgi:hypothetical protein